MGVRTMSLLTLQNTHTTSAMPTLSVYRNKQGSRSQSRCFIGEVYLNWMLWNVGWSDCHGERSRR